MYRFLQRLWRNIIDERTGELALVDGPADDDDPPPAAPHDRRRAQRDRGAALQHRDRQADRAQQPPDEERRRHDPRGGRGDDADGGAVRAARRRGAVAPPRPRRRRSPSSRSPRRTRRCSSRTRSSTRCRSTARCAAASSLPPSSTPDEVEAAALADAKVVAAVDGATPKKVIVVPGRMVNVVRVRRPAVGFGQEPRRDRVSSCSHRVGANSGGDEHRHLQSTRCGCPGCRRGQVLRRGPSGQGRRPVRCPRRDRRPAGAERRRQVDHDRHDARADPT